MYGWMDGWIITSYPIPSHPLLAILLSFVLVVNSLFFSVFLFFFFQLGQDAVPEKVHCLCNHLTSFGGDFFVAPNNVEFEKVWVEFGRLGESGNYAVLATVCCMLGLYIVGLIFARRTDMNDVRKVNKYAFSIKS